MKKSSFIFYTSWKDAIKDLPPEVRLEVYESLISYVAEGSVGKLSPIAQIAFNFIKSSIDKDLETYIQKVERLRENASKGGIKTRELRNASKHQQKPANAANKQSDSNLDASKEGFLNGQDSSLQQIGGDNDYDNVYDSKRDVTIKKKGVGFSFDFVEEDFRIAFEKWCEYKISRKEKYTSELSLREAYKRLLSLSDNNPAKAILVIDFSIANNYSGLFAPSDDAGKRELGMVLPPSGPDKYLGDAALWKKGK